MARRIKSTTPVCFWSLWSLRHYGHLWLLLYGSCGGGKELEAPWDDPQDRGHGHAKCVRTVQVGKMSLFFIPVTLGWWAATICYTVRRTLHSIFDEVITVERIESGDSLHLSSLGRPELGNTFTKINCWTLTQYTKCVFLDADTLVSACAMATAVSVVSTCIISMAAGNVAF